MNRTLEDDGVTSIHFVDNSRVYTIGRKGKLTVWILSKEGLSEQEKKGYFILYFFFSRKKILFLLTISF